MNFLCLFLLIFLYFHSVSSDFDPKLPYETFLEFLKEKGVGCSFVDGFLYKLVESIVEYDKESLLQQNWFDVGANLGQLSLFVNNINSQANIYSFEPFDPVYRSLYLKVKDIPNIHLNHLAISNETGIKPLYTAVGHEDDKNQESSLSAVQNGYYIYQYINTSTLTDYVNNNNINNIFFMKIDTEGYDGVIIKNSEELFKNQKIKYLYFEFHYIWKRVDPTIALADIYNILVDSGYNVYFEYNNAIYISKEIFNRLTMASEFYCFNVLAIRKGSKSERNIMRRVCPKCGY